MAEKVLNRAQVSTFFKQVRAKCVAQSMWMDIRWKTFGYRKGFDDAGDAARGKTAAPMVDQQRGGCLLRLDQNACTTRQKFTNRLCGGITHGNVTLLLSLAANQYDLVWPADVVQVDADKLRVSNTAAIEQFQDRAVTRRKTCRFRDVRIEQPIHLLDSGNPRQF